MAYRPSILLSKEAVEAIKKHYADRGEKTSSNALYRGPNTYVAKTKEASDLIGASMDARANAWNQLTVKAALSQGEEDVKISLGMLGTPAQYKAAVELQSKARIAQLAESRAAVPKARAALVESRRSAEEARSRLLDFDYAAAADESAWQKQLKLRVSEEHWAREARDPNLPVTTGRSNDSERKGRAFEIDQGVIESAQRNREFVDQPLGASATSNWDGFVGSLVQAYRTGRELNALFNTPVRVPATKLKKLWKEGF